MSGRVRDLAVYRLSRSVGSEIWLEVAGWDSFARGTIGRQYVRSADSIAANIAEGAGRIHELDGSRFFGIALGSARETIHWAEVAQERSLTNSDKSQVLLDKLEHIAAMLTKLIRARRSGTSVAESNVAYPTVSNNQDLSHGMESVSREP